MKLILSLLFVLRSFFFAKMRKIRKRFLYFTARLPKRVASLLATGSLIAGLLVASPTLDTSVAVADPAPDPSNSIVLTSENDADGIHANLTASASGNNADTSKTMQLFSSDSSTAVDSKSSDSDVNFQVSLPITGYKEYYVKVNSDQSNTVSINNPTSSWSINITSDKSLYGTSDTAPVISWASSQSLATQPTYALYFATSDGVIFNKLYSTNTTATTSGTIVLPRFQTGNSRTYKAYMALKNTSATNISQLTAMQSVSKSIVIYRKQWTVDLSLDKLVFGTNDTTPKYNVTLNQPLYSTGNDTSGTYGLYVFDQTAGTLVTRYAASSYRDILTFNAALPRYYAGDTHSYVAYVATYLNTAITSPSQLTNIQGISSTISTLRKQWTADLNIDLTTFDNSNPKPKYSLTLNQPLYSATGDASNTYAAYFFDKTTGALLTKFVGSNNKELTTLTGSITNLNPGDSHQYIGYIANYLAVNPTDASQLTNIQATTSSASTSRTAWTLSLGIDKANFSTADITPKYTATFNQPLYSSTGDMSGAYSLFIFDQTTGSLLTQVLPTSSVNNVKTYSNAITRFENADTHSYIAYIASSIRNVNVTSPSQLTNIQATSGTVSTTHIGWTVDLSVSSSTYKTQDAKPVYTALLNQPLGISGAYTGNAYALYVADITTGDIIFTLRYCDGGLCTYRNSTSLNGNLNKILPGETHFYKAYVAPYNYTTPAKVVADITGILATSGTVSEMMPNWTVNFSATPYSNSNLVTFDAYLNQNLFNSNGAPKQSSLYFFNQTQDKLVAYFRVPADYDIYGNFWDDSGQGGYTHYNKSSVTVPYGSTDLYAAYIADPNSSVTSISQLTGIKTTSNVILPTVNISGPVGAGESKGGGNGSECDCQSSVGKPVNTLTGEEFENVTDMTVANPIPLSIERSYSSTNGSTALPFGNGWSMNYGMVAKSVKNGATPDLSASTQIGIVQETGSQIVFTRTSSGSYVAPYRVLANLMYNATDDVFVFTRNNGYKFYLDGTSGKLKKITDLNNNELNFTYANGNLTHIEGNDNKYIDISWSNSVVDSISDYSGRTVNYGYDSSGNLLSASSISSQNSNSYTYDSTTGLLATITTPDGGVTTNTYVNGKVTEQKRPDNTKYKFTYDTTGATPVTTVTNPDNTLTYYAYNAYNQQSRVTTAYNSSAAATTYFWYASTGGISQVRDPLGYYTYYNYDDRGNLTYSQDANLNPTYNYYNALNKLTSTQNAASKTSTYGYDIKGNLTSLSDYAGNAEHYAYNPDGSLKTTQSKNEVASSSSNKTEYAYDAHGFINSITDPYGAISTLVNYSDGRVHTSTNALGKTTTYAYDTQGHQISVTDPLGNEVQAEYYPSGQLKKQIDAMGHSVVYTYTPLGQIDTMVNQFGTTTYTYYPSDKIKTVTDYANRVTTYTYDARGNVLTVKNPKNQTTTYTYDLNDQLKTVKDANNHVTTYGYDPNGNTISVKNPNNDTATAEYNELNLEKKATSNNGTVQQYAYDENGLPKVTTYADTSTQKWEYDANGNVAKSTSQDNSYKTYTYDENDNLLNYKDEANQTTSYAYDPAGQLSSTTKPDQSTESYHYYDDGALKETSYDNFASIYKSYTYNENGQTKLAVSNGVSTQYNYDSKGRLSYRGEPYATNPQNGISYGYDSANNISAKNYIVNGLTKTASYAYDANGNISTIGFDGVTQPLANYTYDNVDNQTGVSYNGGSTVETDSYDPADRLTGIGIKQGATSLYSQTITLNKDGFITQNSKTTGSGTTAATSAHAYGYDSLNQLASDNDGTSTKSYGYDALKNLTSSPQSVNSYNSLSQITNAQINATTKTIYTYDGRGNRTEAKTLVDAADPDDDPSITGDTNYSWSADNKLSSYNVGTKSVSYTYDDQGLTKNKTLSSNNGTALEGYLWDITTGASSLVSDGSNYYVYGNGEAPIAQIGKISGAVTTLYGDTQGSVVLATDAAGGVLANYEYDAYGNVTSTTDSSHAVTPFAYVGEYLDSSTGLYNLRARWYDAAVGSFLSLDPAILSTGEGYSYASGNPLSFTDPFGLSSFTDGLGQFGWGLLDGATGGISTMIADSINPSLINHCSGWFTAGSITATVATFLIPAVGPAIKLIGGGAKVAKFAFAASKDGLSVVGKSLISKIKSRVKYALDHREQGCMPCGAAESGPKNAEEAKKFFEQFTPYDEAGKNRNVPGPGEVELDKAWDNLTKSATEIKNPQPGKMFEAFELEDKTKLYYRYRSETGGPTIQMEINSRTPFADTRKIHIQDWLESESTWPAEVLRK